MPLSKDDPEHDLDCQTIKLGSGRFTPAGGLRKAGKKCKDALRRPFCAFLDAWPVLQREMREGARRPVNHRLRFCGAGVGTLLFWAIISGQDESGSQMGGQLLGGFHALLLGLIFFVVPALTADCISREKRDGTLGLLFLTPMSAGGIIAGKTLALALRAITLWLALLPLLSIPFLAGGVTWFDALSALSLEFCAAVLCITAGFLASTLARDRNMAFVLAYFFSAIFLVLFSELFGILLLGCWRGIAFIRQEGFGSMSGETLIILAGLFKLTGFPGWNYLATFSPALGKIWLWLCLGSPLVVLSIFFVVSRFAAARIEHSWQDKVPSARRESLIRRYCTPFWQKRFQRRMHRKLDWNPVAWLQAYSWKARLSKWYLCMAFLLALYPVRSASDENFDLALEALLLVLAGFYTFAGVNGFLEEKRSGALELLLVTPLSATKIILGRAWGLWTQFLPASLVLLSSGMVKLWEQHSSGEDWSDTVLLEFILACGFFVLPVFATYFALRAKNLLAGAALTWIALLLPSAFASATAALFTQNVHLGVILPLIFLSNGVFAMLACYLLRHSLSRRIYAF